MTGERILISWKRRNVYPGKIKPKECDELLCFSDTMCLIFWTNDAFSGFCLLAFNRKHIIGFLLIIALFPPIFDCFCFFFQLSNYFKLLLCEISDNFSNVMNVFSQCIKKLNYIQFNIPKLPLSMVKNSADEQSRWYLSIRLFYSCFVYYTLWKRSSVGESYF